MMKWKYRKGSYTVEAALLMGIILSVFVALIYLTFLFHDRSILQGAAHEAASVASLHADSQKQESGIAQRLVTRRCLAARGINVVESGGKKKATIHYRGTIRIPMFASAFFGKSTIPIESEVTLTKQRPTVLIQKLRGAAKIVDRIRGE